MLRRLKVLGATESELLDVYDKQVRSVLELAVPVWQPALTLKESNQIESVQKTAFCIILGNQYENYENALNLLGHVQLSIRREKCAKKLPRSVRKNPQYSNLFCTEINGPSKTRPSKKKRSNQLKTVPTRTYRYKNSPLHYMTKLLNQ